MRFLLLAVPLLLAGCGADESANNSADVRPALRKGPILGSVDLSAPIRASGASPFWALEIEAGRITFTDFAGAGAKLTELYPISPKADAEHATFSTQTPDGAAVTITLTRIRCEEKGAPPVENPLTAEIQIGARKLSGCARQRPWNEVGAEPSPGQSSTANASRD